VGAGVFLFFAGFGRSLVVMEEGSNVVVAVYGNGVLSENTKKSSYAVKVGLAQMLRGGVIMDVVDVEQARIAEEAGAVAVMALERVPADIRAEGGVARMSDPGLIKEIKKAVTIPVMAKARIGEFNAFGTLCVLFSMSCWTMIFAGGFAEMENPQTLSATLEKVLFLYTSLNKNDILRQFLSKIFERKRGRLMLCSVLVFFPRVLSLLRLAELNLDATLPVYYQCSQVVWSF